MGQCQIAHMHMELLFHPKFKDHFQIVSLKSGGGGVEY